MKKKILSVILLISILTCMLTSCGHEHEFGEWTVSRRPTCQKDGLETRTCECGEQETRTIVATGHSYTDATCTLAKTCSKCNQTEGEPLGHSFDKGLCSVCEYIDPVEKNVQLETATSITTTLGNLKDLCDAVSDVYKDAWYFVIYKAEDYYSYTNILTALSNYTGVSKEYINDATIDYLEYLEMDTTQLNGLAALRTMSAVMTIMEIALDLMGVQDTCEDAIDLIVGGFESLNGKVIGEEYAQALADYCNAVLNYYTFAISPTGSYNSYTSSITSYRNLCINAQNALTLATK